MSNNANNNNNNYSLPQPQSQPQQQQQQQQPVINKKPDTSVFDSINNNCGFFSKPINNPKYYTAIPQDSKIETQTTFSQAGYREKKTVFARLLLEMDKKRALVLQLLLSMLAQYQVLCKASYELSLYKNRLGEQQEDDTIKNNELRDHAIFMQELRYQKELRNKQQRKRAIEDPDDPSEDMYDMNEPGLKHMADYLTKNSTPLSPTSAITNALSSTSISGLGISRSDPDYRRKVLALSRVEYGTATAHDFALLSPTNLSSSSSSSSSSNAPSRPTTAPSQNTTTSLSQSVIPSQNTTTSQNTNPSKKRNVDTEMTHNPSNDAYYLGKAIFTQ